MDHFVPEAREVFEKLHRDPSRYPLFARVWEVLQFAPSSRNANVEELVSLAADALDYLVTYGRWATAAPGGRTELRLDGGELHVYEDDDGDWRYRRTLSLDG